MRDFFGNLVRFVVFGGGLVASNALSWWLIFSFLIPWLELPQYAKLVGVIFWLIGLLSFVSVLGLLVGKWIGIAVFSVLYVLFQLLIGMLVSAIHSYEDWREGRSHILSIKS